MKKRNFFYWLCGLTLALCTSCEVSEEKPQNEDETPCCESCLPGQSCENCVCTGTPSDDVDPSGNSGNHEQTPDENQDIPCDPACSGDNVCHQGTCMPKTSCEIHPCTPDSLCIQHRCSVVCNDPTPNVGYDILIQEDEASFYVEDRNEVWINPGMKILNSAEDIPEGLKHIENTIAWDQVSPEEMVVLVWAGEKGSTGYQMSINRICENTSIYIDVLFCERAPHDDAMTWPYMVIKVPKGEYTLDMRAANNYCP